MRFKNYREWNIPEAATKAAPGDFLAFIFIWMVNGISAAGRITIIMKYTSLTYGILKIA
ncbi:TPA: hypothetical protein ACM87M_000975 [Escherichia coli O103:H2]